MLRLGSNVFAPCFVYPPTQSCRRASGQKAARILSTTPMAAAAATATARFTTIGGTFHGFHTHNGLRKIPLSFSARPRAVVSLRPRLHPFSCLALHKPGDVQIKQEGAPETLDYRVFFLDSSGKKISPWHDIPLRLGDGVFNFIVEIPKETSAKMEVATEEPHTPIKQDTKKGKLRYYPYNINWNYGLLPQTWEDPSLANIEVEGAFGDNDPVDVVEIGDRKAKIGEVLKVKPLAALAMIDEGELDWKVVAISLDDPRASLVNDVDDVEKHFPGTLTAIRDWFRDYKIPDGKPANKFGLGNKAANKDYALKVITETNESWAKLVRRSVPAGELSLV
ncbi:putative inorganic diphosphatase [Dioscorea sansibarensis]